MRGNFVWFLWNKDNEEDKVNIVVDKSSYHFQLCESDVQTKQVKASLDNKVVHEDVPDLFFNEVDVKYF